MTPEQIVQALQAGSLSIEQAETEMENWLRANSSGGETEITDFAAAAREFVAANAPPSQPPVAGEGEAGRDQDIPADVTPQLPQDLTPEEFMDRLRDEGVIPSGGIPGQVGDQDDVNFVDPPEDVPLFDLLSPEQQRVFTVLGESGSLGGRAGQFRQFLAGNPDFGNTTEAGRQAQRSAFNPLSAAFSLRTALNPDFISDRDLTAPGATAGEDIDISELFGPQEEKLAFSSFLRDDPQFLSQRGFADALQGLAPIFADDNQNDKGIRGFLEGSTARNIITQQFLSGINPVLRSSAAGTIGSALDRFRLNDVTTPFLKQLIEGGIGSFFRQRG